MSGLQQRVDSNTPLVRDFRAIYYGGYLVWAVVFFLFPPMAFHNTTDIVFRAIWLGTIAIASIAAIVGVISRIDFKLELPAIAVMTLGPLLYAFGQVLVVLNPVAASGPGIPPPAPDQRYALIVFALLPALALLPRIVMLYEEAHRVRKLNSTRLAAAVMQLRAEQSARRDDA